MSNGRACCVVLFLLFPLSGCAHQNGILELGPALKSASIWMRPSVHSVHVGETVVLTFRARVGKPDYAVYQDVAADYFDDCGPPIGGRFEWNHTFTTPPEGGQARTRIVVRAYAQNQRRDFMPVDGRLEDGSGPTNESDTLLASAYCDVVIYQSEAILEITPDAPSPEWKLSKLILHRADGASNRIGLASKERRGFSVKGPDKSGRYVVTYKPAAEEVNTTGHTEAELLVADQFGKTQRFTTSIPTP